MFCKTKTKPKVSEKKGATGQSFIPKEITTYRIGTLVLQTIYVLNKEDLQVLGLKSAVFNWKWFQIKSGL